MVEKEGETSLAPGHEGKSNKVKGQPILNESVEKDVKQGTGTSSLQHKVTMETKVSTPAFVEPQNRLAQFLLMFLVFVPLLWVGFFTVFAAEERFREKVSPKFESKYFTGSGGGRVFTYMGVFYIWIGAFATFCLYLGVRLPKPSAWWVRSFRVPFIGGYYNPVETAALALFVAFQIATFATRIHRQYDPSWTEDQQDLMWYEVSKTFGKTVAITLVVLFLPICKSCFWWDLFNFRFERAVKLHTWLAWFMIVTIFLHATIALISFAKSDQLNACLFPWSPDSDECTGPKGKNDDPFESARLNMYGWLGFLTVIPITITSLPWFRRQKFEWFYYTHFFFIPFIIFSHLHYDAMVYYSAPGMTAYILDRVLWLCSVGKPVKLISLSVPVPGYVRMEIAVEEGYSFEPGQWVQINVPSISRLEWHPMSIASAPGNNSITIDIKVLGDWTQRIYGLAKNFDPSDNYTYPEICLDGFHGSSHSEMNGYLTNSAALMFAGGIGITPLLSSLRSIVEGGAGNVQRVVFVWVVKTVSVLELYSRELAEIQAATETEGGCEVEVLVHITRSEEKPTPPTFEPVSLKYSSTRTKAAAPFMRQVKGYGHKLMLVLGAGGGYLLGLFLVNVAQINSSKEWRPESTVLAQLGLATLFCGLFSFLIMSSSFFDTATPYRPERTKNPVDTETDFQLDVVFGKRPDIPDIMNDMKKWCQENGYNSVGVGVCGPDSLVQSVMTASKIASSGSSSNVTFVVDDESFEW